MYYSTRLSHIVDGFILPAGMRVWVVCTHTRTRTRLPDGYIMLPIYVPAGRNIIPYPSPHRVKPLGYSGFRYLLPSLVALEHNARPASKDPGVHTTWISSLVVDNPTFCATRDNDGEKSW
jgi:hypothetical protein